MKSPRWFMLRLHTFAAIAIAIHVGDASSIASIVRATIKKINLERAIRTPPQPLSVAKAFNDEGVTDFVFAIATHLNEEILRALYEFNFEAHLDTCGCMDVVCVKFHPPVRAAMREIVVSPEHLKHAITLTRLRDVRDSQVFDSIAADLRNNV